jgi:signal transduction histidine kinase
MSVAGRLWTIRVVSARGFVQPWEAILPLGVLVVGVLVSTLLFGMTWRETRSREEAERAARRSSFLAEAGKLLASSFDYRETLALVTRLAARDLMDWCVVLIIEPDGPVRLIGHRDEERAAIAASRLGGLLLDPEGRFGAAAAFQDGGVFFAPEVDEESLTRIAASPEHLELLRGAGLRSLITVPLRARDETFGAITFASSGARVLDHGDIGMAEDLGRLAVAAIDTARMYRRAQQAVRIRDEFLTIASHELKTPLTSLALQADSLIAGAARGQVPAGVAHKAEVIRRNVDRLARLISNLLDLSRIGAGRMVLEREQVDLGEVVREVLSRFDDEAARAGCHLRLEGDASVVGRWDRLRLDQVVTNLVSNAVKYGPGRPITITLREERERAVLSVRDEGIGIPTEAQQRIFERFERAVPARHYGGFGLGLWIVRRIVEALGGTITVESEPGQGALFVVVLEREAKDRPETPAAESADRSSPASR